MDNSTKYQLCKSHDENLMPIYCEDCECPVCMTCLTTSHLQHKICKASTYFRERHGELMESLHGENSLIEKMKNDLICKRKTLEERKIKLIDEISNREEAIVSEVRDIGKQLKKTVSDAVSECEEKIQKSEEEIENLSEIPDFDTETETNCIKILQFHCELRRLEREVKIHDPVKVTFEAVKNLSRRQVEDLFGNVIVQHDSCLSSNEDRQIERKCTFHDKNGSKLFFCNKKIKDQENRIICFQFKPSVETIKMFKEVLFSGGKMFMHVDDKLFEATDDNCVREVLQGVDSCVGLSSGRGILFIRNNRSAVSLYLHSGKCMPLFSVPEPSKERILTIEENEKLGLSLLTEKTSRTSNKLLIYRVKENGQANAISNEGDCSASFYNFNSIYSKLCLLKDTKSQIAIVLRTYDSLEVYDQQLSTLFTYKMSIENSVLISSLFSVASACLDQDDNILVANGMDNSIHMLDIKGQFLRIIVWPEDGLSNVMSLSVDGEGWLWCVGRNNEGSYLRLFDYEYLKTNERTKRAMTETEENF